MNNRIREVRKYYNVSQTVFGAKIGQGLGVIKNLEQGKTTLTNPLFEHFCEVFNVNPEWLHSGVGEMFNAVDNSSFSALKKEYNLSPKATNILQNFLNLSQTEQDEFIKLAEKVFDDISHNESVHANDMTKQEEAEPEDNEIPLMAADSSIIGDTYLHMDEED